MSEITVYQSEPTRKTPWVVLEPGRIFMMGRSISENPGEFFRPVYKWIQDYAAANPGPTSIHLGFEYINTSSTKWVYSLLRELSVMEDVVENASVNWYYDQGDDDMAELGFILRSLIECPFVVTEINGMGKKKYEQILKGED
ncbi:MAG: DUF1987 domain-containing protein [Bacteroidales bacterium]